MSRPLIAFLIGTVGFIAYIAAAVWLGDLVVERHWTIQLVYFIVAGIVWVFPVRRLMIWGAGGRGGGRGGAG